MAIRKRNTRKSRQSLQNEHEEIEILEKSTKSSTWTIRTISTIALLLGFAIVIYIGHAAICLLVLGCQYFMYREIVKIGFRWNQEKELPLFRTLNWYFYICMNFFVSLREIGPNIMETRMLGFLLTYHSLLSYSLFCLGLIVFVLILNKKYYKYQFQQIAWTLITLLVVVYPSLFIMRNVLHGLIWFVLPAFLVSINDIFAFIFGKCFGRTPLIQLSPKKTWEGFIGATLTTFIFGFVVPWFLSGSPHLICPRHGILDGFVGCAPHQLFVPVIYQIPHPLSDSLGYILSRNNIFISIYPMQWVGVIFAAFASIIAPFGGFLASGFKRAYSIKDFGDSIPGHGGVTDRMDCQLLMGVFVYVYIATFVDPSGADPAQIVSSFSQLSEVDKIAAFQQIHEIMKGCGLI